MSVKDISSQKFHWQRVYFRISSATVGREATFHVIMPVDAFITEFSMTIDNVTYPGEIKEKEVAKKLYERAKVTIINRTLIIESLLLYNSSFYQYSANIQTSYLYKRTTFR